MQELTTAQSRVLVALHELIKDQGGASLKDLANKLGHASHNASREHLNTLMRKGFVDVSPRGQGRQNRCALTQKGLQYLGLSAPLLGVVSAGLPRMHFDPGEPLFTPGLAEVADDFWLEVRGDSMIGAGILWGDYILVRSSPVAVSGDIAVVLCGSDECTLKRIFFEEDSVRLAAENPSYADIVVKRSEVVVQGVMKGLLRKGQGR